MRLIIAACAIIALCSSAEAKKAGVLVCDSNHNCYPVNSDQGRALIAEQEAQKARIAEDEARKTKKPGDLTPAAAPKTTNQPTISTSNSTMTTQPTVKTLNTGATQMKPIKGPCPVGHPTC